MVDIFLFSFPREEEWRWPSYQPFPFFQFAFSSGFLPWLIRTFRRKSHFQGNSGKLQWWGIKDTVFAQARSMCHAPVSRSTQSLPCLESISCAGTWAGAPALHFLEPISQWPSSLWLGGGPGSVLCHRGKMMATHSSGLWTHSDVWKCNTEWF